LRAARHDNSPTANVANHISGPITRLLEGAFLLIAASGRAMIATSE
jgi:hypothetical protein